LPHDAAGPGGGSLRHLFVLFSPAISTKWFAGSSRKLRQIAIAVLGDGLF
jgi:hypothetical protein